MANTIRISFVENMPEYVEFDYKNPTVKQRIRRKIKATPYQADLLKDLLDTVLDNNYDRTNTIELIRTNVFYSPEASYLEETINSLYFNYIEKAQQNVIEREQAKDDLLKSIFPLQYDANFCLLGKAGVGKSTLIKKVSSFWNNDQISFPFTDTSRTSTFPSDYCFVSKPNNFKFLAIFTPKSVIELHISECIERAINKYIDLSINPNENIPIMDAVFNAFVTDPSQTYDIRYSIGRYIKTTSPAYTKKENMELIHFWHNLFCQFKDIIGCITNNSENRNTEALYYQLVYSDAIKSKDETNGIYQTYLYILQLIENRSKQVLDNILQELKNSSIIHSISCDLDDEMVPYFSCQIDNMNCQEFYSFIQLFTTKKSSLFGHSLFNMVNHLRIEMPLNPNIELPQKGYSFVIQDTIGIAHSNDGNGGFENSTTLKTDDIDAVVLIDDSRLNGDNNITAILQHLVSRMNPEKIYFAFSFFDELTKEDFDEDDDINDQRISYLTSTEANSIRNILQSTVHTKILIDKLNSEDTFFLQDMMNPDHFESVQKLINTLITHKLLHQNRFNLFKPNPNKPFVVYDYKKLPLLYEKAINAYYQQQKNIYLISPPHYKTTEALTYRLSYGVTFFNGARNLHPVDDLYNFIIVALSPYIDCPQIINIKAADKNAIPTVIGLIKSHITESIRKLVNTRFLNQKAITEWNKLYNLSGTGSDKIRREGIITTQNTIAPGIDSYLNATVQDHLINTIEDTFKQTLKLLEIELYLN